ncbi:MAG: nicotinate (nicotinamide) nucleotide adenylyltransferase [Balneolaceae bacterium]|nr:MAG: nicotinate (nicotinamide) nucleotide adenylyltransferase [Balneolaceae bacterium]
MGKRIGILGGTFDPVHIGHIKIVESFLKSNLLDEIHILVAPDPPHKTSRDITPFHHRFEMAVIAFSDFDNVIVSDLENQLPMPSFTIHTIEYLKNQHPDDTLFLCMGEDNIQIFDTWHKSREILDLVTLMVAERPGFNTAGVAAEILEKTIFVDHEPIEVSSSEYRNVERKELIPESVLDYIHKNELYGG